jgi:hypothetical protein
MLPGAVKYALLLAHFTTGAQEQYNMRSSNKDEQTMKEQKRGRRSRAFAQQEEDGSNAALLVKGGQAVGRLQGGYQSYLVS